MHRVHRFLLVAGILGCLARATTALADDLVRMRDDDVQKGSGQPSSRPAPPGSPASPFTRGGLWSGHIRVHFRLTTQGSDGFTDYKTDVSARLREFKSVLHGPPAGKPYGSLVHLEPEGSEIHTKLEMDVESEAAGTHCMGAGTLSQTFEPNTPTGSSVIWINDTDADTTPWIGFPIVRATPLYHIHVGAAGRDKFKATCTSWHLDGRSRQESTSTMDADFYGGEVGKIPIGHCPPAGQYVCDPQFRTIAGRNGRMHGAFHNTGNIGGDRVDLEVSWSLCRDDAPCKDEPPEPEKKPCGGTAQADALLGQCHDAERAIERQMKPHWDEYQKESHEASQHLSDYKLASHLCTAWDVTMKMLETLLESDIPLKGLSPADAAEVKEFQEALGKLSGVIGNLYEGKSATDPFLPENIQKIGEYGEKINNLIAALHIFLNATPEELAEKLQDCGAPLSDSLYQSARQYLLHLQASLEALRQVNKLLNDLRSQENKCLQLQLDAYKACLDDAACRGTDPKACDSKKPPGNWAGLPP
jgi:hypothetical protein